VGGVKMVFIIKNFSDELIKKKKQVKSTLFKNTKQGRNMVGFYLPKRVGFFKKIRLFF